MKSNVLFASLCLVCATGFVGAIEKKESYLKFELDRKLHITEYKAKNMGFLVPVSQFMGEVLTEAVPLSEEDKAALENGFANARDGKKKKQKKASKVNYTLEDMQFVAAIKHKKDGFSVKVTEKSK